MCYIDYLKLYIRTCTPIFLVVIIIHGIMGFLGLMNPVYILPGTIIGNFIMPMFLLTFWLWQKQCDLL